MANKYKVLKDFVLNGTPLKAGEVVELTSRQMQLKSIKANIEKAPEDAPVSGQSKNDGVLGSVKPGVPLTPEQKAKLAAENARLSADANKQASDQLAKDRAEGRGEPVVKNIAESLQNKLVNEEFQNKGVPAPQPTNEPQPDQNQPGDGSQAN